MAAFAFLLVIAIVFPLASAFPSPPVSWGQQQLDPHFYDHSCPQAQQIVASIVGKAHYQDPRMAASLLRLHFHDCFVKVHSYIWDFFFSKERKKDLYLFPFYMEEFINCTIQWLDE